MIVNQAHFQCETAQILQACVNICANWIKRDKAVGKVIFREFRLLSPVLQCEFFFFKDYYNSGAILKQLHAYTKFNYAPYTALIKT